MVNLLHCIKVITLYVIQMILVIVAVVRKASVAQEKNTVNAKVALITHKIHKLFLKNQLNLLGQFSGTLMMQQMDREEDVGEKLQN